jgi:putative FmdB family regulatory protein
VAIYEYRCAEHGTFDLSRPLGSAPSTSPCRDCGREATRVYSAAFFRPGDRAVVAAMDRAEKSRTEPEVVRSVPRAGDPKPISWARDPRQLKLPRP